MPSLDALDSSSAARSCLAFQCVAGLSRRTLQKLAERYVDPARAFGRPADELRAHCSARVAAQLARGPDEAAVRSLAARLEALGARVLAPSDREFPDALRTIPDPPAWLYAIGQMPAAPGLAIVGARKATLRGSRFAETVAEAAVSAGVPVVSGLAYGIDAAAHDGALRAAQATRMSPGVAVWASGFDRPAPRGHARLARRWLEAGGAWISEYPPGVSARAHQFPERNRLVSGLAQATLVVEARLASGSLWTARHALDQGREVLAVPGPIDIEVCRGSNALLRDGAAVVLEVDDVLALFGKAAVTRSVEAAAHWSDAARRLWDALAAGPADLDELMPRLSLDAATLARALTQLELDGRVQRSGTALARR